MKYFYHITEASTEASILQEGLKPGIGTRSESAEEDVPAIYLSDRKSVPVWLMIFQEPVILHVDKEGVYPHGIEPVNYECYREYICYKPIEPKWIRPAKGVSKKLSASMEKDLCISFLNCASHCVALAHYDATGNEDAYNTFKRICRCYLPMMRKLDFTKVSGHSVKSEMKYYGENGCYTLCDRYSPYGKDNKLEGSREETPRLWELLGLSPHATDESKQIYNILKRRFGRTNVLFTETGGWTG